MGIPLETKDPAAAPQVRPLGPIGAPDKPPRRPGGSWLVVAAGVIGLVAGLLIGGGRSEDGAGAGEAWRLLGAAEHVSGLADAVPGYTDVLLAVGTDGTRPLELMTWPPSGGLDHLPLPASWTAITFPDGPFRAFAQFDASGYQIALAAPVYRGASITLLAGRPEAPVAVASGVTSYAWHATLPRSLAYVVEDTSGRWLEVMDGSPRSVRRIAPVAPGRELIAWINAGYLMSDGPRLILVAPAGSRPIEGSFLDAAGSTVLVDIGSEIGLVDGPSGELHTTGIPGGVVAAEFAAGRNRVAVARSGAVEIWEINGGIEVTADVPAVEYLAWSSDGRFLIAADRVDVVVIDATDGSVSRLGLGRSIAVASRPVPLSSP